MSKFKSFNHIKNTALIIKGTFVEIFKNDKNYISETFDEALERIGVSEEEKESHIKKTYNSLRFSFNLLFIVFVILLGIYLYNFLDYSGYAKVSFTILIMINGLYTLEKSFRCFQIRHRTLYKLNVFLKKPKEWFPLKFK